MLLCFGVANHRSIRDYQELFLSASRGVKRKGLTIPVPTLREAAVPVAAIYGPNAAGKSNLIHAMREMRRVIVKSHVSLGATAHIPRHPFRLDNTTMARPTKFDCTFTLGNQEEGEQSAGEPEEVYEYGFEYTAKEFQREWLYRMVRNERQRTHLLFKRKTTDGEVRVKFGSQLRGKSKIIASLTRPNSLFLSAAAQNNHPQLTNLYRYFAERWNFIQEEEAMDERTVADRLVGYEHTERLEQLISQADVGISGMNIQEEEVGEDQLVLVREVAETISKHSSIPEEPAVFRESVLDQMRHRRRLRFIHSGAEGGAPILGYDMESKGTRTLISFLVPALEVLSRGSLFVIDELDTSLHPSLARAFVSLFSKKGSNPHGAQLIFSTHDVTLLGMMHRDEIWMTDKNHEGASRFTPLTDFKLRSRDDVERAYRYGRFGGYRLGKTSSSTSPTNDLRRSHEPREAQIHSPPSRYSSPGRAHGGRHGRGVHGAQVSWSVQPYSWKPGSEIGEYSRGWRSLIGG